MKHQDKLVRKFVEETGVSAWDWVNIEGEPGKWLVVDLWSPRERGGMDPGLNIELTKSNSRTHFQVMTDDGILTSGGKRIKTINSFRIFTHT